MMSPMKYIIREIGVEKYPNQKAEDLVVVDVGCGNGDEVYRLKKCGYQTYGCDFQFKTGEFVEELEKKGDIRKIDLNYKLSFDNEFADIVYTNQVVEHVQDIEAFFSEISRITKPGGLGVHCYPNINRLTEPHLKIPLATRLQKRKWIQFWINQKLFDIPRGIWMEKGVDEIIKYLDENTRYRTNRDLKNNASRYFSDVWFDGNLLLHSISNKKKGKLFGSIPGGGYFFNALWTSLLFTKK